MSTLLSRADTRESNPLESQESRSLPPWLWFWLVVYTLTFPTLIDSLRSSLNDIFSLEVSPVEKTIVPHFYLLYRLLNVPEVIPSLVLLLGILTIFIPWIRAAWLERHFDLTEPPSTIPALQAVSEFVHRYAPDLRIKVNLRRFDQLAFVYPLGYRTTAVAIFGGLITRWRSDRQAAEAILLHELAHYRNGDTLIVGAGSFFPRDAQRVRLSVIDTTGGVGSSKPLRWK